MYIFGADRKEQMRQKVARVMVVIALVFLANGVFGVRSACALQSSVTQEVNIDILPDESELGFGVPGTGQDAVASGEVGDDVVLPYITVVSVAAVFVVIALVFRYRKKRLRPFNLFLVLGVFGGLIAVGCTAKAAILDPSIALSADSLTYALHAGESASLGFSATAGTSSNSTGYAISSLAGNYNEDIILDITGGIYTDYAEIPSSEMGEDPLVINLVNGNAGAEDTSDYTMVVSVSDKIPVGQYKMMVTYFVNTDEGEFFRFSVDTRLTDTLDTDANHLGGAETTFAIPTSGYIGQNESHKYSWVVDWGDGGDFESVSGVSDDLSEGVLHTYATPGMYQITIWPSGQAAAGWLNAFGFYNTNVGANTRANKDMFLSVDTSVTDSMRTSGATYRFAYMFFGAKNAEDIPSYLFDSISTGDSASVSNMFNSTFSGYAVNSTSASIPGELFSVVDTGAATDMSGMFTATFFNFANNSVAASIPSGLFGTIDTSVAKDTSNMFRDTFFGHAAASANATIPAGLFSSIHLADGVNASDMFGGTFYFYAGSSTSGTIPDGLFSSIDTTNAGNITGMFSGTFSGYARSSTAGGIPANLFSGVNTSKQKSLAYLFNGTFSSYAYQSNITIPAGLFAAVDASSATNVSSMFAGTFSDFAGNSTVATIPSGLFDSVNTANATNTSNMFRDTFSNYAGLSTIAEIPVGLFDSVTTKKSTNTSSMFSGSFYFFGHVSPVASIPTGLFAAVDLSVADNVYEMFYRSFDSFAYESTVSTDIGSIWGDANFAGRVTADNASSFFNSTFSNVTRLVGSAQAFIDAKLGGVNPVSAAHTFATTAVSDLLMINVNWR